MNNLFRPALNLLAITTALVFSTSGALRAAVVASSWTGQGTTNNWSDPGNWDIYPTGGGDLIFALMNNRTTNSNDFTPGLSINSLTFNSSAAAFTLQGNPIGFFNPGTNTITNNSSNLQTLAFSDNLGAGERGITSNFDLTIDAANGDFDITSNIEILTSSSPTKSLTVTGSHNTTISGTIDEDSGLASGLIKNGSGILRLNGNNSYTGTTTINDGTLVVGNANALGVQEPNPFATTHNDVFLHGGTLQTVEGTPMAFNVPDNYNQDGGTLRIQIGGLTPGTTADEMLVGRNANLGGELFLHRINNFMPTPGDRVTIITTNNGTVVDIPPSPPGTVQGEFDSVNSDFPGLIQPRAEYFDMRVDVVFELGSFAGVSGLTPNQGAVAAALDEAVSDECLSMETFGFLGGIPLGKLPEALDLIAPEEMTAIYTMSFSYSTVRNENLIRRMEDIRVGAGGYCPVVVEVPTGKDYNDKNVATGEKNVVPPTIMETQECHWGFFLNGTGDFVQVDEDFNAAGYDIETGSLIAGGDYRIGKHFAIGIDGGYIGGDAETFDSGRIQIMGGRVGGYATVFGKLFGAKVHLDGAGDGGWNRYDTRRTALSTNFPENATAQGETDGSEVNAMVSYGADWSFGCLNVGTWSTLQYTDVNIDGFNEKGSLIPLHFPDQDQDSLRSTTGLRLSYDKKFGSTILRPEIRAAWFHEYGDRAYDIKSNFIDCPTLFTVHGPALGRDAALVGAGFSLQWNGCLSTYVYYDGVLGRSNYDSNAVSGGVRFGF